MFLDPPRVNPLAVVGTPDILSSNSCVALPGVVVASVPISNRTMSQRRVLDSISKILVRCMLLIVNFNICDSFLGSSFGRSQAPITSASGILGKSVASGDSGDGRYMHPPLSLHASSRGEGSLDSPRLTRIISPPVVSIFARRVSQGSAHLFLPCMHPTPL